MIRVLYFSINNAVDVSAEVCVDGGDSLGDLPNALVVKPGYYTLWDSSTLRGGGFCSQKRDYIE
ncbi:hypothetical protein [Helicobacter mesocricetorum]|uniref:hypothetical protein n=1 Tax=Helicobacter mesocricetorum TaxID=87012 RepID=UPI000CF0D488|nr:hypothetical protein [Helicobacter mesocricetorum]